MRLFFLLSLLESLVTAQIDGGECTYAVELLFVQDVSTSFDPWVELMAQEIRSLMGTFKTVYAEFKLGLASFVDKPIPSLGLGTYGGKSDALEDYCYHLVNPLSESPEALEGALIELYRDHMGSGGDWPEAPLEALAYAAGDGSIGWSTEAFSPGGRPNVRVALVVTDDISHMPGDVDLAIHQSWEYPRAWVNESYSTGGFGATTFFRESGAFHDDPEVEADYATMSKLFHKYDQGSLTNEEAKILELWTDHFGPYPWPKYLANPNDGGDPSLCPYTEYIAPEALGMLLREKNIVPVFVSVANQYHGSEMDAVCRRYGVKADAYCLQKYYQDLLDRMGLSGASIVMEQTDLKEKIIQAVGSVAEMLCQTSTSTTTTTTEGEVATPQETEVAPPLKTEVAPEETEVAPPSKTEVAPEETEVAPPNKTEVAPEGTEIAPPHETGPVVPPPVTEGGSSTGTIAGATAGAAGLAALGGLLYRKFGGALFGSSPSVPIDTVQQVEVPENPVERETMEEVTMDMFQ